MPRRLGQHFLVRDDILRQIATAACGDSTPRVIEIGPGRGALTRHLLERTEELYAIELDGALLEYLRTHINDARLHIHHANVLETDLSQWGAAVITGNLPYYITSPIMHQFVELDERFNRAVFLMQEEVANRVLASPGRRDYGYLSVSVQLACNVSKICRVPPSAFRPPPKVDSAALLLDRKAERPSDLKVLLKFASQCFAHKRKTLRNNLAPYYGSKITAQPESGLRAEQLTVDQLRDLHARVTS